MSNHTPGPWFMKECIADGGFYIVASDCLVVDSYDIKGRYGPITNEANARLISRAPELFDSLEKLTKGTYNLNELNENIAAARQIIAQIKVETK